MVSASGSELWSLKNLNRLENDRVEYVVIVGRSSGSLMAPSEPNVGFFVRVRFRKEFARRHGQDLCYKKASVSQEELQKD